MALDSNIQKLRVACKMSMSFPLKIAQRSDGFDDDGKYKIGLLAYLFKQIDYDGFNMLRYLRKDHHTIYCQGKHIQSSIIIECS